MTLKIISATDVIYEGEVTSVTLPGALGSFTVLHGHASLVSTLTGGTIEFTLADSGRDSRDIPGGLADIDRDVISVCIY
ncbi:MAG: F0F1 ATP synthase subunit epsilon [Bacteroides sp.]|nr:F0F1 ATP synthase subunit epsilon [Bacteroides sp.]MCM1095548.1 F0F1 ATP synthase subunit epsilon [Terasakiella sp.]